ncbi:MAG: MFS transporter [Gammaproteobacteria bacterium]|nr:MFS transporter [Gammaproteobacteria bacterium]NIR82186.1 MFS transporter [Gammaproteobacteria bacterium]NIU02792.1 MFS transporter [Gammaproteobacteria bacterium]NIX84067.1 hypothetical protein [Gammaproteobacteria bacterium]
MRNGPSSALHFAWKVVVLALGVIAVVGAVHMYGGFYRESAGSDAIACQVECLQACRQAGERYPDLGLPPCGEVCGEKC